jgi:beta-galactosidase
MTPQILEIKVRKLTYYTLLLAVLLFSFSVFAAPNKVKTYQDENGWKLLVDGKDHFVKGMVWGYDPIGQNYSYNLWGESEEYIKNVLDYDFGLMKAAGVNTVRYFGIIPPKWVTYVYEKYGIMTIMNHMMGRYGHNIGGAWIPQTNYADELTRTILKNEFKDLVRQYKDVPGVIMFALGNENNYGLEWKSFEIEDLPEGERYEKKAEYLYSLYNETIKECKEIDSDHPYMIVNGDIQYLGVIKKVCTELDILGSNVYRGISFTDMWKRVKEELGLPLLFTEFGADAYNALKLQEEVIGQATWINGQWNEIYNKVYGKGEEGIALGGTQFSWRDGWWKYKQTENLFIQDNNASWSNGGYDYDFIPGVNNMNEEWWGICRLGYPNRDGVYVAEPRMAYYVLQHIWSIDPYNISKDEMNEELAKIDMKKLAAFSNAELARIEVSELRKFRLKSGGMQGDLLFNGKSHGVENYGKDGLNFSSGEMFFLDFEFQPMYNLQGEFKVNILGNIPDKQMEEYYGKRGMTFTALVTEENPEGVQITTQKEIKGSERVEIYSFQAEYRHSNFDLNTFYHIPRYHYKYVGDFFGLVYEATDMEGMDIWNDKAPYGVEITGKKLLNGLTILTGPEIYWGANPKAVVKYDYRGNLFDYTLMHSEDFGMKDASSTATVSIERATRQSSLYFKTNLLASSKFELGYLVASSEKIGDDYFYVENDDVYKDQIEFKDTQALKGKLTLQGLGAGIIDASFTYAGLVADGGSPLVEFETLMPYSGLGNKIEAELGMLYPIGNFWLLPRGLYRKNLIDANPIIEPYTSGSMFYPGVTPRNRDKDPFAVLGNREAISAEFFLTYDPTPASFFYNWDRQWREDAHLAFSIGGNYTSFKTDTDSHMFYYLEGQTNAPFGVGLEAADVWTGRGTLVLNPNPKLMITGTIEAGRQQSTGTPEGGSKDFYTLGTKFKFDRKHILDLTVKKDAWGPLDWYRQFNITYPWQVTFDYSMLVDRVYDELMSGKIGFRALFKTLDEMAPDYELEGGRNDYVFQTGIYYKIVF